MCGFVFVYRQAEEEKTMKTMKTRKIMKKRGLAFDTLESRALLAAVVPVEMSAEMMKEAVRCDVNTDYEVNATDVITIINRIDGQSVVFHDVSPVANVVAPSPAAADNIFSLEDISGDGLTSALDALMAINFINRNGIVSLPVSPVAQHVLVYDIRLPDITTTFGAKHIQVGEVNVWADGAYTVISSYANWSSQPQLDIPTTLEFPDGTLLKRGDVIGLPDGSIRGTGVRLAAGYTRLKVFVDIPDYIPLAKLQMATIDIVSRVWSPEVTMFQSSYGPFRNVTLAWQSTSV